MWWWWWWWWFLGPLLMHPLPGTETAKNAEEMAGALGGSVTFPLTTSRLFVEIIWLKGGAKKTPFILAILKTGGRCQPDVALPAFEGRLSASEDCKRLEIRNLTHDDAGIYTAQIQLQKGGPLREIFHLQVYKHLSEGDLLIQCEEGRRLKCFVGPWADGVRMDWTNTSKAKLLGDSVDLELSGNDTNQNLTCTARNPVSKASRTVSFKEVCNGPGHVPVSNLLFAVAVMIVSKVMISACVFAKWPCCPGGEKPDLLKEKAVAQERSPQPQSPSPPEPITSHQ